MDLVHEDAPGICPRSIPASDPCLHPKCSPARTTCKPLDVNSACASAEFEPGNLSNLRDAIFDIVDHLRAFIQERKWVLEFHPDMVNYTDFLALIHGSIESQNR